MPTYSIHHFSAQLGPTTVVRRPKSARRIAMNSLAASVATRKSLRRAA